MFRKKKKGFPVISLSRIDRVLIIEDINQKETNNQSGVLDE